MRNIQSTVLFNWFEEVWNKNYENAIDEFMNEDAVFHGIETQDGARGTTGFKLFFRDFTSQFHDVNIDVEDVVCEDDMECARTLITATHTESNKPISFPGICMARVGSGKIMEAWNSYDFLSLNLQLGQKLVPA